MKSISLFALLTFCVGIYAQPTIEVDEVHELSSIVWRLAGVNEYSQCYVKSYADDIDNHFNGYKDHPLIEYCKELRTTQGIAYDAIPTAASFLCKTGDGIDFVPGYDARSVADADGRWTEASCAEYVALLDSFYRQSRFDEFFVRHKPLYDIVTTKYKESGILDIDMQWFENTFGTKSPDFNVFVSVNNGPSNYGAQNNYPANRKGILIGMVYEKQGQICVPDKSNTIPIHEICHAFANPLVDKYKSLFDEKGIERFFCYFFNIFPRLGIGASSIPYEWLTRLTCIYYCKTHDGAEIPIESRIGDEMRNGFIWMKQSYALLDSLMENKSDEQSIEDFVPMLIKRFNQYGKTPGPIIDEYENMSPRIVEVIPKPDSELNLEAGIVTFTIKFSEDMHDNGYQLLVENPSYTDGYDKINMEWENDRTCTISIPTEFVKGAKLYGFMFDRGRTVSKYGFTLTGLNSFNYEY